LSEDAHKTPLGVTHGCGLYLLVLLALTKEGTQEGQPAIKMDLSCMEWTG